MIVATGGLFALVFLTGVASLYLHCVSDVVDSAAHGPVSSLLGFFGIGGLPVLLALGVFAAVAGAAGMAHVGLAHAVIGSARPTWLPFLAAASAAGLGLLGLRAVSRTHRVSLREKHSLLQKVA